ncbi:Cna B-type domain-containing protein, partial [Eubacteriales bacterium OttesenSCG-928-N13]|nr:Cna B-type domain-containing protein [Eubacteriales bacterium OttesenSCG-928-N13]
LTGEFTENDPVNIDYIIVTNKDVTNKQGGEITLDNESLKPVTEQSKGSIATQKPGYRFIGWFNDIDGSELITDETELVAIKNDDDIYTRATYYAQFEELSHVTIRYVANAGGSVSTSSESINPEIGVPRGAKAIPASEYHFLRWTNASGSEQSKNRTFAPTKRTNETWVDGTTYYANFELTPLITISGTKTWVGVPEDEVRPSITIQLYQNGGSTAFRETTISGTTTNFSFPDVPRADADGVDYHYEVREVVPNGFTPTYNGFNITNAYTPGMTSVAVSKEWTGVAANTKLPNVTIRLLRDGVPYRKNGSLVTMTLGNGNWSGQFNGLPQTAASDGHTYMYTVTEDTLSSFTLSGITGNMQDGFVITNAARMLTVTFTDWNGSIIERVEVLYGDSAQPPVEPTRENFVFDRWDGRYTNVTKDEIVVAHYTSNDSLVGFDTDGWVGSEILDGAIPLAAGSVVNYGDCME